MFLANHALRVLRISFWLMVAGPSLLAQPDDASAVVRVSSGAIRGEILPADHGAVFKGVPFAAPPLRELRWREPQPVQPWNDVRDCRKSGAPSAQPDLGWNREAAAQGKEDCLYLDVWTPSLHPKKAMPVMVWIHGGANMAGSGGFDPLYDGKALISHGVVLVVIQYRLGVFGFLAHPALTAESSHHASGNYAILDQIAALHWVRENAGKFGGDPNNVTLFGQSAGALDISALMTCTAAKGLFQRAIVESGATRPMIAQPLADAEEKGALVANAALANDTFSLEKLRAVPADALLKAGRAVNTISVDGWLFPVEPLKVFTAGKAAQVPMLIGSITIELPLLGNRNDAGEVLKAMYGEQSEKAAGLYDGAKNSLGEKASESVYGSQNDQIGTDLLYLAAQYQGERHSQAGNTVWQYEFARAIPPHPNVVHSGELSYVFGNLFDHGSQPGAFTEDDRRLSAQVQQFWTNFAKTGNPNGAGLPEWPRYTAETRRFLRFDRDAKIQVVENPRAEFFSLYRANLR